MSITDSCWCVCVSGRKRSISSRTERRRGTNIQNKTTPPQWHHSHRKTPAVTSLDGRGQNQKKIETLNQKSDDLTLSISTTSPVLLWYCVVLCGTVWFCVVLCGTVWYCVVVVLEYCVWSTGGSGPPGASRAVWVCGPSRRPVYQRRKGEFYWSSKWFYLGSSINVLCCVFLFYSGSTVLGFHVGFRLFWSLVLLKCFVLSSNVGFCRFFRVRKV